MRAQNDQMKNNVQKKQKKKKKKNTKYFKKKLTVMRQNGTRLYKKSHITSVRREGQTQCCKNYFLQHRNPTKMANFGEFQNLEQRYDIYTQRRYAYVMIWHVKIFCLRKVVVELQEFL